jgi:hypothetical protein
MNKSTDGAVSLVAIEVPVVAVKAHDHHHRSYYVCKPQNPSCARFAHATWAAALSSSLSKSAACQGIRLIISNACIGL